MIGCQYRWSTNMGVIWDGYGNYNEGMLLTYNQGTWLGGCLELYNITQDKKVLLFCTDYR